MRYRPRMWLQGENTPIYRIVELSPWTWAVQIVSNFISNWQILHNQTHMYLKSKPMTEPGAFVISAVLWFSSSTVVLQFCQLYCFSLSGTVVFEFAYISSFSVGWVLDIVDDPLRQHSEGCLRDSWVGATRAGSTCKGSWDFSFLKLSRKGIDCKL